MLARARRLSEAGVLGLVSEGTPGGGSWRQCRSLYQYFPNKEAILFRPAGPLALPEDCSHVSVARANDFWLTP